MRQLLVPSLICVGALALPAASPSAAGSIPGPAAVSEHASSPDLALPALPCAGASNLGRPNGNAIVSQDFEPPYDLYDSLGAADFKSRSGCRLGSIFVDGKGTPPVAVRWAIYTSTRGHEPVPDKLLRSCTATATPPHSSSFTIEVEKNCILQPNVHYWLSIQAKKIPGSASWKWATTNVRAVDHDVWKNPGGGWQTGCFEWGTLGDCLGPEYDPYEFRFSMGSHP